MLVNYHAVKLPCAGAVDEVLPSVEYVDNLKLMRSPFDTHSDVSLSE